MKKLLTVFALCAIAWQTFAQKVTDEGYRSNIIKLDITCYWLYRNALNATYERMTTPNQSFAITAGYNEFPRRRTLSQHVEDKGGQRHGLKFGAEYRFYLVKENKFHSPHGVYIGPYITNHRFYNDLNVEVDNNGTPEQATLAANVNIFNMGAEIGYQFIIKDRWVIDMVVAGPSLSNYRFNLKMGGNYTFNTDDITNEIILDLINRFPTIGDAIDEGEGASSGKLDLWYYGWRYQCHIGYYFGRKK